MLLKLLLPRGRLFAFNLVDTWYCATQTATLVTDRLLLASARVIAEQVRVVDGHEEVAIQPAALDMFASARQEKIVYQVTPPDGELLARYPDAPQPASAVAGPSVLWVVPGECDTGAIAVAAGGVARPARDRDRRWHVAGATRC